jgi:mRNA-degrading endonuclease toxin of MazEF toxin-antitoxin module
MTSFDPGEVVLVPFPFTDQSASKQRPAVVVSSTDYNHERPDLIVLALTSLQLPTSFPVGSTCCGLPSRRCPSALSRLEAVHFE